MNFFKRFIRNKNIEDKKEEGELKYKIPTPEEWGELRDPFFIYTNDGPKRAYTRLRWKNNQLILSVNPKDYDNPKILICDEASIELQNQIYKQFWEAYKPIQEKKEKLLKAWGNFEDRVKYHKDNKKPDETDEEYQDFLKQFKQFYIDRYNCTKCPTVEGRIIPLKKWDNQEIIYGGEKWKTSIEIYYSKDRKASPELFYVDCLIVNKYNFKWNWTAIGSADQKNIYEQITGDKQEMIEYENKNIICPVCGYYCLGKGG